ncbi:hypothetical protein V3C99_013003 [Haemonchus contortus]
MIDFLIAATASMVSSIHYHRLDGNITSDINTSSQTKVMQRRMNNLMIYQTVYPVLLLHTLLYIVVLLGTTSGTLATTYVCQTLWTAFPVLSALITLVFFKEYRTLFLSNFFC